MVVFVGEWVARIPMAALVAVMIMVSIGTFNWTSIRNLSKGLLARVLAHFFGLPTSQDRVLAFLWQASV
jgi:MFS superfamily sulfate permease-like transporter